MSQFDRLMSEVPVGKRTNTVENAIHPKSLEVDGLESEKQRFVASCVFRCSLLSFTWAPLHTQTPPLTPKLGVGGGKFYTPAPPTPPHPEFQKVPF